ncbi:MAG: 4Fe-4S binding protein [Planctomycetota bacterium]|nr:4Fe-4S binding protein [Planctomycetota bacterium]
MRTRRRIIQAAFLLLTIVGVFLVRGNAERWCPFGGVEAAYTYIAEGNMICSLGVSNFYILGGLLVLTLLLRRAFCGYVCPIGALSEWLQGGARKFGVKPLTVPRALDRALSVMKYLLLALILVMTWRTAELWFRGFDPCYAMLGRHGEDITIWAYIVAGAIVLASLLIIVPFCRWLCPLAAVMHPFSRFGFARIKRDGETCIDCNKCSNVCPMAIPVAKLKEVHAARCTACLECLSACPEARGRRALAWGPPRRLGGAWPQTVLIVILLLSLTAAVVASYAWPIPSFVQVRGTPPAEISTVEMRIEELTCRGRGTMLWYFLQRDDLYAVDGYLKLEAWPGPGAARAVVTFDPALADETRIRQAITEPFYDVAADFWRPSPFAIEGYDPLDLLGGG